MPETNSKIATFLLSLCTVLFLLLLIAVSACVYLYNKDHYDLYSMSQEESHKLYAKFEHLFQSNYRPAWFYPDMGFTLKPHAEFEVWGAACKTNDLGYRTYDTKKEKGTLRVLFVGDSWTYGMGVRFEESFPVQFEKYANEHSGYNKKIQSWTLGLPAYNTVNQIASLSAYIDLIQPDAVVFCPTINDADDTVGITERGIFYKKRAPAGMVYPGFMYDSFQSYARWNAVFDLLKDTEQDLKQKGIPTFFFYVAGWNSEVVHYFVSNHALHSPYVVTPHALLEPKYLEEKWKHGTPAAYGYFARMIYRMLQPSFSWNEDVPLSDDVELAPVFYETPKGNWEELAKKIINSDSVRGFSEEFVPGSRSAVHQMISVGDPEKGRIGQYASFVLIKKKGGTSLSIDIERNDTCVSLSDPELDIIVHSAHDRALEHVVLDHSQRVQLMLPDDIEDGTSFEVEMTQKSICFDELSLPHGVAITKIGQF
ncbi:SGNH/GDSL hydrolase family protein [Desulfovibrio inopinatus]|uniref:SGNH/GDSL hydrolase family protein n=1 Tax=Desulfovibrio inopinatus TaxID=102109 RepID=UPI0004064AB1|nr:SGNH/GDSL hydrolase family protein [Desulfovibrio inopinatus]